MSELSFGAVPGNCSSTLPTDEYTWLRSMGKALISQDGYETLRAAGQHVNLRMQPDGGWMDRRGALPCEVLQAYEKAIGCMDTRQANSVYAGSPVNLGSGWELIVATGEWVYDDCEILQFGGSTSNYVLGAHYDLSRIEGLARTPIHYIDWSEWRHIPKGSTIQRASIEIAAPETMVFIHEQWVQTAEGGSSFIPPTTSTLIADPSIIILGRSVGSGYHNAYLGSVQLSGTLEAGKRTVFDAAALFSKLNTIRESANYVDIALVLGAYAGAEIAFSDPAACKAIGYAIIQGWFGWSYSNTEPFDAITFDISRIEYDTDFIFGTSFIQVQLPTGLLNSYKVVYGNRPTMG